MTRNHLLVVLLSGIWSAHFLLMSVLSKEVSPFTVGCVVRFGTLILLTAALLSRGKFGELFTLRGAGLKLLCVGLLGFLLDATSFIGFRYSNADTGTVLLKTDVLMANLITIMFYKQQFRRRDWFFTATVLVGVCLVLGVNPYDIHFQPFDVFFILSALFVTLNAFLIQHLQVKYGIPNQVIAYYNNLFTLLLFTTVMLAAGQQGDLAKVGGESRLFIIAGLGAVMQTLIYLVYYRCLAALPVYIIKILLLLIPVFTMLFNIVLHWRLPTAIHLVGSALVLGSAFGILYSGKPKNPTRESVEG